MTCPSRVMKLITLTLFGLTLITIDFFPGTSLPTTISAGPGISKAAAEEQSTDDGENETGLFCDCSSDSDENSDENANQEENAAATGAPCSCGNGKTGVWARKDHSSDPVTPGGSVPKAERQIQGQ